MPWMALPIMGGLIGQAASAGDRAKAEGYEGQELRSGTDVQAPTDLDRALQLQQYQSLGTINPNLEQSVNIDPSQVGQISEDPSLRNAQFNALRMMQQRAQTGLNPEDRAAFNQMRNQVAQQTEGKRQQILQNFASRGQGGSGAELMAQLQSAQGGANDASAQGDRLAAQASQNALQSLSQSGQLGGQIRQQDFGVNQAKAQAIDELNRFKANMQSGQQQRNVGAQNQAAYYGLGQAQGAANANTSQGNAELQRQKTAEQQQYEDALQKAGLSMGAYGSAADSANKRAAQTAQSFQMMGSGAGQAGTAASQYGAG